MYKVLLCCCILSHTDTVKADIPASTGGGRPRVPLRELFQARVGT